MANEMRPFAKISANLHMNVKMRKFALAHPTAAWLWVIAITYSVAQKTDGFVDGFAATEFLGASDDDLAALRDAGLFEPVEGGWLIHDFLKWQTSVEEQEIIKAKRAEAGRVGGKKSGETRTAQANAKQVLQQDGSKNEANAKQVLQANTKQNEAEIEVEVEEEISPYSPPAGDGGMETEADGFDAVWRGYPKHAGKPKAVKAYASAVEAGASPKLLLDAATAYAAKVKSGEVEARWVPTLANWLANDTWRDHVPEAERVELPSESWLQTNFDQPLTALGLDSVDAMLRRRRLFAMIRDGTPPNEAAQRIINETNETKGQ